MHTFTVKPTDSLGNPGVSASFGWRVDGTAPETTLASAPAVRTTTVSATFTFSASEPSGFECKLDAGAFAPCSSPKTHTGLTRAAHSFEVRAVDGTGNVDPTPAIHRWTIGAAPVATRRTRAASALLAPRAGARVTSPPLLRWRRVPRASYYNVQLFRGSVKVLSSWPTATRLQLRARWTTSAARDGSRRARIDGTSGRDTGRRRSDAMDGSWAAALSGWYRVPAAKAARRRLFVLVAIACLLLVSGAAAAPGDIFTAASSPSHVKPTSSATYTITLTNAAGSPSRAGRATIVIPPGFSVQPTSVQATTQAVGGCTASLWLVDGPVSPAINLRRPGNNDTGLCPGATLTVSFTATSAGDEATYTWATHLFVGETEEFALNGSQPTVVVDGTRPVVTIGQKPANPSNSRSANFSFTLSELLGATCKLDNGPFVPCTSPIAYANLSDGPHTFTVAATDAAGNTAQDGYAWTVETRAPTAAVSSGPAPLTNSRSATFVFPPTSRRRSSVSSTVAASCLARRRRRIKGSPTGRMRFGPSEGRCWQHRRDRVLRLAGRRNGTGNDPRRAAEKPDDDAVSELHVLSKRASDVSVQARRQRVCSLQLAEDLRTAQTKRAHLPGTGG